MTRMLEVECGDMREVLRTLPENSFDACVCDPPYELSFMGKAWDGTGIAFDPKAWAEVLRVLKPGAHIVAFGGTRTWHRIAVAIEDAGFQIRDNLAWLYGQGFPKSMDLSKAIDKAAGLEQPVISEGSSGKGVPAGSALGAGLNVNFAERPKTAAVTELAKKWAGWGTALKPSFEPIILARKPLIGTVAENVAEFGVGGLHIDACRTLSPDAPAGRSRHGGGVSGNGSSYELPDSVSCMPAGRWPPNVCVDEAVAADLDETFGTRKSTPYKGGPKQKRGQVIDLENIAPGGYSDAGGVSRYFYCPKAGSKERDAGLDMWPVLSGGESTGGREEGSAGLNNPRAGAGRGGGRRNPHPTVKPLELMRWLCRLVTPPGGFILDPFAGSGTTGCAAALEGFHFAGVELDPIHVKLAQDRIAHWASLFPVDKV